MRKSYSPSKIESIIQKYWYKNKTFSVAEDSSKEKYYCLSMIPYPSGNLHMGHVRNYTIGDVISRYQRMLGKNVLQPIGWDAFGLPAEHAAIINNTDPEIWTKSNICYMKSQLQSLGFAYDWSREIITCQPQYYRWEQWFFTILYKKGLVYKKTSSVNWCPYHETVLANEQVINNCCWRCHTRVKYKKIPQWFIKITNYADQLLYGLDQLKNWPKQVKIMQRNWIGRSEGVNVTFNITNCDDTLTVYITRLDIFMGITCILVSIDHPIVLKIAEIDLNLAHFIQKCNNFNIKPSNANVYFFEKKGMPINIYAIHPITNSRLPIWVANFVVPIESDGIGAAILVPAHNQQDWEFAHKYSLPVKTVIKNLDGTEPSVMIKAMTGDGILFNSGEFNGLSSCMASNIIATALIARGIAQYKIYYRLKDWCISRQRYWGVPIPMITLENGLVKPVLFDQLPVILPKKTAFIQSNRNNKHVDSSLKMYSNWIRTTYKGQIAIRDTDTFDTFMESSWYYARYTCPHYSKAMLDTCSANYWLPIDQYIGGIEHAIMHLLYFRFYHKLMRDEGLVYSDEPAIRLLCQGMVLADSFYYLSTNDQRIWVDPTHVKIIKRDKVGHISKAVDENGRDLIYAGMCKMSKSKNNGIDPNIIIKKYGADAVRFFIMFAAPIEAALEWKESGLEGAQRFLRRVWNLVYQHIQDGPVSALDVVMLNYAQKFIRYNIHKTIEKVTDDIDRRQSFNTALAAIMKLVNELYSVPKKSIQDRAVLQEALSVIVRLLYPFTPHISFILWRALGGLGDIDHATWPTVDMQAIINERTLIIVQINGKMRHKIYVPLNSDKNVISKLLESENVLNKYLIGKKIRNIIFVPNRVINIII
ncbi:leucine--tRNA ligase [Candidatus Blochmannia sp. SNP]|uniref:leucine--tRNA ligase n=1 Tax=Candidatus Blochmannia sp. SNP TaxID=3118169 RepID=UPI002F94BDE0